MKKWNELALSRKKQLVNRAVAKAKGEFKDCEDVVTLGPGYRKLTSDPAHPVLSEPVVCFLVREKWEQGSRKRRGRIPDHLTVRVTEQGQQRSYQVPTDVDSISGVVLHNGSGSVWSDRSKRGAICCVVRGGGKHYALSCQHVLMQDFPVPPATTRQASTFVDRGLQELTLSADYINPGTNRHYQLDCSLVQIPANELDDVLAVLPAVSGYLAKGVEPPRDCFVCAPRASIGISATYAGKFEGATPAEGRNEHFEQVFSFSAATLPGDSGAAIVADDRLVGIYFAGDSERRAYALPAWLVFEGKYFTPPPALQVS